MLECKQIQIQQFFQIQGHITPDVLVRFVPVFVLGRGIAGIPHSCKKSPKFTDTVQDKSPTLNHVTILFKIRLIFIFLEVRVLKNTQNPYRKENFSSVVLFITIENQSNYKFKLRSPNNLKSLSQSY